MDKHLTGTMELKYADQFRVSFYDDNIAVIEVEDGLKYLAADDPDNLPGWLPEDISGEMTVIPTPVHSVYNAASSAMDLIDAADAIDSVIMTSTQAGDWSIEKIKDLVESDKIRYIGKYRAPDYEALLEEDVDLAIESTMIYHTPQVKEAIEELGIPVLVERSSYESEPLGRLEWIKLYGLLLGKTEEAQEFFDGAVSKLEEIDTDAVKEAPSAAFFSVNSNGSVVVRKPGDYVTKMIEMAGGTYALSDITDVEDNALSTMNMQMESFYAGAKDADILIYNSTIVEGMDTIEELLQTSSVLADFKAVKTGDVWCSEHDLFQRSSAIAGMIKDFNAVITDTAESDQLTFLHKLK